MIIKVIIIGNRNNRPNNNNNLHQSRLISYISSTYFFFPSSLPFFLLHYQFSSHAPSLSSFSCSYSCSSCFLFLRLLLLVVRISIPISLTMFVTDLITGAGGGQLRTHYYVTFPHVVSSSLSGAVDKRVMHLELQLHRNWQRRAGAGGTTSGSQLIGGNDYVNEKLRKALIRNSNTAI